MLNLNKIFVRGVERSWFIVEHAKNVGFKGKHDKGIARYAKEQDGVLVTKYLHLGNILWYDEVNQIELPFSYMLTCIGSSLYFLNHR